MDARTRRLVAVAFVIAGAVYAAWMGFGAQTMGDYPTYYASPTNALLAGHFGAFFAQLPADGVGGSLLIRAPAALVGKLLVGGQLAIFRFGALFCMLVLGGLGLALARSMREEGKTQLARASVIGLCVLAPVMLNAIQYGHPEEPLGAALCVGAVLLAGRGRTGLAGVALGLALINKPWALFAVPPALLAASTGRFRLAAVAGVIAAGWTAAAYLGSPAAFSHELHAASFPLVAHPADIWWPFAHIRLAPGVTPAYFPPRFISDHARELAVLLALPLSIPLARRRGRSTESCLALLALLFLVRCALDPANHVYYDVPFVIALVAWEARARSAPVVALAATIALWLTFHTIAGIGSLDAQFAAYLASTLPLAMLLARPAFGFPIATRARLDARRLSPA